MHRTPAPPGVPYRVDPVDPRAPPLDVWQSLTAEQRAGVVAELPSELSLGPPEGDEHREAKERVRDPLRNFFDRVGRRVYLSSELPVYYPGERVFAPDLLAVLDVDAHKRERWVAASEGRGLDFVLEVHVGGSKSKDYEENVARYARLGIPEYFIFEPVRSYLRGFTLGGARSGGYRPLLGQNGRYPSAVLGLDLGVEDGLLRFFYGDAVIPETRELLARAQRHLTDLTHKYEYLINELEEASRRADEEARLRAEEARLRAEEARLREEAERALAEARAEIERLRADRA